ncbi:METTL5 family protein [Candidatus Hecatella orcuttiae]|jgi:putative methylase|uniref:METTL5 family protein n=1 Tax=Candidatus Hecatella orcuttiae TaxID=1935119 RepID=UPI002867C6C7|nr:METTL5 family protein [Candidatus Hecatella orcuttiae]
MEKPRFLVKRKQLERFLSQVKPHPAPKLSLEQYTTPAPLAAALLYTAAYTFDDIVGKTVCDLGCGSGILSLGAAYLGAETVVAVDVDKAAVEAAKENAERFGLEVEWVVGSIELLRGAFHTALQNPPFGVWRRGADVGFLRKALSLASTVYSIHKSSEKARSYLDRVARSLGGRVTAVFESKLTIPRQFGFHRKPEYEVKVNVYRIVRDEGRQPT